MGDPQTGEQLYHRSSPTGVKVLSPTSGFPAWGSGNRSRNPQRSWLWRPAGFDCRTSTGLRKTETQLVESTHKVLCTPRPKEKEQLPHRRLNHTYLLVLEDLLQRWGAAVAHHRNKGTGSRSSGKYSSAWALPEAAIIPTKEPVGSSAGSPQAKQLTGTEHSPTHQQTSGLKFYRAQLCLPEQDPVLPTTSPSHQEA